VSVLIGKRIRDGNFVKRPVSIAVDYATGVARVVRARALVVCVNSLCFTYLERVLFRRLERDVDEDNVDADPGSSSVLMQEEIGERAELKSEAGDLIGRHQGIMTLR
jgi:hypothetical protein